MKKLLALVVLLAAAVGYVRGTPEYSYYRLRHGLETGDLPTVETHLDLSVVSSLAVDLLAANTAAAAKENGGTVGEALVNLFAQALAPAVKGALAPLSVDDVKKTIAAKGYATKMGNFVYDGVFDGMRSVQRADQSALLDLTGKCGEKPARLKLVLEKRNGPVGSLVPDWRVVGVDKASLPEFAAACASSPAKAGAPQ